MINRKSESIKLLESIQTNLKESITIDEIEEITQRIESAEDMDEIQQIIYTISDGVLEDEVQHMFDSCNEDDDLDEVKSLVLTTLEDNAEYDESSLKESKITESVNIGDKVKILNSNELHNNKQGEVTYIDDDIITVKLDNGRSFNYDKNQVQKIEEEIENKINNKDAGTKMKEAETPEAMQKIADKQMPEGGYRYITTHGIGPGTLPKDVRVFKTEDIRGGRIAMYISRPLTSEELKQYDIKPEWIQEDSSYRRYRVSFFVDTDSMSTTEIEEKLNELLKGSGLASTDETIDVEKVEDLEEKLNESYDMYNVIEDSTIEIRNLKEKIDKGEVKDIKEVSRLLGIILRNIEENISDAW